MTFLFKIRIFDKHERQSFVDGEEVVEPIDSNWYRFDYYIDLNKVQITSFREYILFDSSNDPTRCIKIFLSDEEYLYGSYSIEKFVEIYNTEYKAIYTAWAEAFAGAAVNSMIDQISLHSPKENENPEGKQDQDEDDED